VLGVCHVDAALEREAGDRGVAHVGHDVGIATQTPGAEQHALAEAGACDLEHRDLCALEHGVEHERGRQDHVRARRFDPGQRTRCSRPRSKRTDEIANVVGAQPVALDPGRIDAIPFAERSHQWTGTTQGHPAVHRTRRPAACAGRRLHARGGGGGGRVARGTRDNAYEFFVIETGEAEVRRGGEVIATLEKGDVVGEIGLHVTGTRTASVVSTSPITLVAMFTRELKQIETRVPAIATSLRATMRDRVARTSF
jgi:CRP-like cAMP-binding protein